MFASLIGLWLLLVAPMSAGAEQVDMPAVRQAIRDVLELETGRSADRLPRVTLNAMTGELTVVFAMRRPLSDDPRQIVASATDDVFTILWATYASPAASQIRKTTVLGTYAVIGRYEKPKEIPLIRADLSAERAMNFDWTNASAFDPNMVLDAWWVEGELLTQ